MSKRWLVMGTGGLDTTLVVDTLLANQQKYDVGGITVARLNMHDAIGPGADFVRTTRQFEDAEIAAVNNTLLYLHQVYSFPLFFQRIDNVFIEDGEWSELAATRRACVMLNDNAFDVVAFGQNAEQVSVRRGKVREKLQLDIFSEHATRGEIRWPLIEEGYGRPHAYKILASELVAMCVSCTDPTADGANCGECRKCRRNAEVKKFIDKGHGAGDVFEYLMMRKRAGKYEGLPGGDPKYKAIVPEGIKLHPDWRPK